MRNFLTDETGAVTVDWVVLTAAVVGLGIAVVATIAPGAVSVGDKIGSAMETLAEGME